MSLGGKLGSENFIELIFLLSRGEKGGGRGVFEGKCYCVCFLGREGEGVEMKMCRVYFPVIEGRDEGGSKGNENVSGVFSLVKAGIGRRGMKMRLVHFPGSYEKGKRGRGEQN